MFSGIKIAYQPSLGNFKRKLIAIGKNCVWCNCSTSTTFISNARTAIKLLLFKPKTKYSLH